MNHVRLAAGALLACVFLSGCATVPLVNTINHGGSAQEVQALLAGGASPNARGQSGAAALSLAATGRPDLVRILLDHGADPNQADDYGHTPLVYAAYYGQAKSAEMLIAAGANVNALASDGTVIDNAIEKGRQDIVRILLDHGADPNEAAGDGITPIMDAANYGRPEIASMLIAAGANVNAQTSSGGSAMTNAILKGRPDIVRILLDHGVDPNQADNDGVTPLINAAFHSQPEIAKMLIAAGVNVNARTTDGVTALINAAAYGQIEIAKMLIAAGANVNAQSASGGTAMGNARARGDSEMANLLRAANDAPSRAPTPDMTAMAQSIAALSQAVRDGGGQPRRGSEAAADRAEPEVDSVVDHPKFHKAERPDDYAIVVGIEKYDSDLPEAQFAERDARAVRAHLVALGYPERNIKFLSGAQASKARLEAYIEDWLPRNVKPDSQVFFYFSGHGAPDPKSSRAYLVPFDGDPNFLDKTAYPVKKLYANLGALKARQVIVALDSCFSGAGGRSVLAEGARPLVTRVDAEVAAGDNILLFSAAASNEITSTLKDEGHGIFTYYFLKGLDGAAEDESGAVTARGLYAYLKPKVQDAASRQNRDQTPGLEGASARDVRFR